MTTLQAPALTRAEVDGVVSGRPHAWLRLEGLSLLVASLAAYAWTGASWWLLALLLLVPDVGALGYVLNRRIGAAAYNVAHATPLPIALVGAGLYSQHPAAVAVALIWLAHIGMDRAMAYGLKYDDDPTHTHLSCRH